MSKIYYFAKICGITITRVRYKRYKKLILWQLTWHISFQLYPLCYEICTFWYLTHAYITMGIFIFIAIWMYFSKIGFWTFGLLNKSNKFLGSFKACKTLSLANIFFKLLSFSLFNNKLTVLETIFESKLLQ